MRQAQSFPAESASVGAARRFALAGLRDCAAEVQDAVQLMVSELATNCIRHVQASFELVIERRGDEVRVEVRDTASGQPAMRSPGPEDTSGRGLRIVDMLAARWGVRYASGEGKTVWFTLTEPARAEPEASAAAQCQTSRGHGSRSDSALHRTQGRPNMPKARTTATGTRARTSPETARAARR